MQDEDFKALQQRRSAKAREREHGELRAKHGDSILRIVKELLGDDFTNNAKGTIAHPLPQLAPRIEDSVGLVAAYISLASARQLLTCCQSALGPRVHAEFYFDEKLYMGTFSFEQLDLAALANLAEKVEDRVLVAPASASGLVIVDYYAQGWTKSGTDFSVIAQGADLESAVKNCFSLQPSSTKGIR